jgi:hypothetical protein
LYALTHDAALAGACAPLRTAADFVLPVRLSHLMLIVGILLSGVLHPKGLHFTDRRLAGAASFLSLGIIIYVGLYGYRPPYLGASPLALGDTLGSANAICERYIYFYAGYMFAPIVLGFADWAADAARRTVALTAVWLVLNAPLTYIGMTHLPGVGLPLGLIGVTAAIAAGTRIGRTPWGRSIRFLGRNSVIAVTSLALCITLTSKVVNALVLIGDASMRHFAATAIGAAIPVLLFWSLRGTRLQLTLNRPRWARFGAMFSGRAGLPPSHESHHPAPHQSV